MATSKQWIFEEIPAVALLLKCISPSNDEQTLQRIQTLAAGEIDWQVVTALAIEHRVLPLLHRRLRSVCSDALPKSVLVELRSRCQQISVNNLFVTAELVRLLAMMAARGVDAMPYKGPILAQTLYGDLSLRQFGDLDIVIQPQDMLTVEALLINEGYRPYFGKKTASELANYMVARNEHSYDFYHDQKKIFIEMHWRFWPVFFSSLNPKDIWPRREQTSLAGKTVLHTKVEDSLVILCMHGSRHQWERLSWLCDIAMLVEKHPELDWEEAIATASQWGAKRMLFLGLYLAYNWLDATLPSFILAQTLADRAVASLASHLDEQMFASEDSQHFLSTTRYQIHVRERWQDKSLCAQSFIRWMLKGFPSEHHSA